MREERSKYGGGNVTTTAMNDDRDRGKPPKGDNRRERCFSLPDRSVTSVVKTSPGILVLIFKGGGGFVICMRAANFIASLAPANDLEAPPLDLTHPPDTENDPPPSSQLPPTLPYPKK